MKIKKATARYEKWLARHIDIVEQDLALKHQLMAKEVFPFLRATYYRWAQVFPEACKEAAEAPEVLAVGDLHVENFGTWRDGEGRLVWGVNDFDEAFPLPYTNDLIRLAASVHFAAHGNRLAIHLKDAAAALIAGYSESLAKGGEPFVLGERHHWLRELAGAGLRDPAAFWKKLDSLSTVEEVPRPARAAVEKVLPERDLALRWVHRVAGLGSLGRERWVALAEWRGGRLAREAKASAPSAVLFAEGEKDGPSHYEEIVEEAVRAPDPLVRVRDGWTVRRLSPDCARVELADLPKARDEQKLLHAMGWETANIHLGTRGAAKAIQKHLKTLPPDWLVESAHKMAEAVDSDWNAWKAEPEKESTEAAVQ